MAKNWQNPLIRRTFFTFPCNFARKTRQEEIFFQSFQTIKLSMLFSYLRIYCTTSFSSIHPSIKHEKSNDPCNHKCGLDYSAFSFIMFSMGISKIYLQFHLIFGRRHFQKNYLFLRL